MELVIFDMDGVIVDSEPLHAKIELEIFKELGIDISSLNHSEYLGMSPKNMWQKIKRDFQIPQSIDELIKYELDKKRKQFQDADLEMIEGAVDLIRFFSLSKLRTALASSSPNELIDVILNKFRLRRHFEFVISGHELKESKPNPEILFRVANHFGIQASSVLVIEDSPNGIKATKNAGMKSVHLSDSMNNDFNADLLVRDFSKLNRDKIISLALS